IRVALCFALLVVIWPLRAAAQTATHSPGRNVALVVGVAAYDKAARLGNPVRDATAVDTALRELAFDTILVTDGSLKELVAALERFYAKLSDADVALLYFAG